jgi:hypothetical protein
MSELPTVTLPATLIGRVDLARLVREVESVDNDFEVQKVRDHKTEGSYSIPTMSRSLSDFLQLNKIDIADSQARMALKDQLRLMKDKSPTIRMVFAAEPEPEFMQQLVAWIRQEIHPGALLTVGLQPGLIGGVYMRTPNHVHDFSVRTMLAGKRDILINELGLISQQSHAQDTPNEVVKAPAS